MTILPPRGIRNNNPGNIDFNPRNKWQGQIGIEQGVNKPRFARFDSPENGIRAIAMILKSYDRKGINTVRGIINRWAPPVENNTDHYIYDVASKLGVEADERLTPFTSGKALAMVKAIIHHENGTCPYTETQLMNGVARAFV